MVSVRDILQKTNQQIELLDDEKKMEYARQMAGFQWLKSAFLGQLGIKEFRTIIEGKRLISQKRQHHKH